ncbi:MAG: neutral/alkaline non-lysosomal ceramidase N-terminal domain-containing protein [Promethearchaeota archaeon]
MKAAFGKVVLTPDDYLGKILAGYTPSPPCTGKRDDIHARAIMLESVVLGNVKKKLLLISLDFLKIPLLVTDYIREKIQEKYREIAPDQILIHAIHTHKSLDMGGEFVFPGGYLAVFKSIMFGAYHSDDRYKVWMAKQIVKMVGNMVQDLKPAKISLAKTTIEDPIMLNRRHPTRRSKSDLGIICVKDATSNEIMGVVVNYSMHPTTLSNMTSELSADYPGRLIHKVETLSGGKFSALFFNGACGDLNPVTTCGTDFEALDKDREPVYKQRGTYKDTTRIGFYLGEKTYHLATSIPDANYYDDVEFKSFTKVFWVPMKDYQKHRPKVEWLVKRFVHLLKRWVLLKVALILSDAHEPNFPGFAIKHRGRDIKLYSMVQYLELTVKKGEKSEEYSIVGVPGELFEDIASDIFKRLKTGRGRTLIFENSNDWIGYLFPIKEYLYAGGYEPIPSFSPLGGECVKSALFELLDDIDANITGGFF